MSEDPFLSRWSRLKKASAKAASGSADVAPKVQARPVAPLAAPDSPPSVCAPADPEREPAALPPVESLTAESDFSPFMGARVDESLRRRALKTLFRDPRFNVMDGLDTYIDDYSQPDPLPEGWLEKMTQVANLGDHREALPEEEVEAAETRTVAAEPPAEEGNPLPNEQPATTHGLPSSDTSQATDAPPPVEESSGEDDRLR